MENTFLALSKKLTKEPLGHYLFLNLALPSLEDKGKIHFQASLLTRCWAAVLWLRAYWKESTLPTRCMMSSEDRIEE